MKSFEKLEVFAFSQLQNFVTLIHILENENITIGELQEYVERKKLFFIEQERKKRERNINELKQWERYAKKCPQCQSVMGLTPVNSMPSNQVGGEWKSMWFCPDWRSCGYEELSKESYRQQVERIYSKKRKVSRHGTKRLR
jgi:hypothetical protein